MSILILLFSLSPVSLRRITSTDIMLYPLIWRSMFGACRFLLSFSLRVCGTTMLQFRWFDCFSIDRACIYEFCDGPEMMATIVLCTCSAASHTLIHFCCFRISCLNYNVNVNSFRLWFQMAAKNCGRALAHSHSS